MTTLPQYYQLQKYGKQAIIIYFNFLMLASKCGGTFKLVKVKLFPLFGPVELSYEVKKVLRYSKTDKRVKQGDKLLEKKKQEKKLTFFLYWI